MSHSTRNYKNRRNHREKENSSSPIDHCIVLVSHFEWLLFQKEVCSVDGCSQEVYKDGLCADHYVDAALSEAAASSEAASESIDPIVAELQGKYQDYIDTAIYTLRNSLKNPKSLDIYNVYVADDSKDNGFQSVYVYVDAAAENGFVEPYGVHSITR